MNTHLNPGRPHIKVTSVNKIICFPKGKQYNLTIQMGTLHYVKEMLMVLILIVNHKNFN